MKIFHAISFVAFTAVAFAGNTQFPSPENNGRNSALPATNLPAGLHAAHTRCSKDIRCKWLYARPTITGNRLLIGATGDLVSDKDLLDCVTRKSASLVCMNMDDGKVIWEFAISAGGSGYGTCSSPVVLDDRVYVMMGQEIVCLDLNGMANGNDGEVRNEADVVVARNWKGELQGTMPGAWKESYGDILWHFNLRSVGARSHDAAAGTLLVDGDYLWVPTSSHLSKLPNPASTRNREEYEKQIEKLKKQPQRGFPPNLLLLDRHSGKVLAHDDVVIEQIFHSQWSSPALAQLEDGRKLVIWPDGGGYLHAFAKPDEGRILEHVWQVDANPPHFRVDPDGKKIEYPTHEDTQDMCQAPGPVDIIATPAIVGGKVYLAIGRDNYYSQHKHARKHPELRTAPYGSVNCFDVATGQLIWRNNEIMQTECTAAIGESLLFIATLPGFLHCLELESGRELWREEIGKKISCRSPVLADSKVYIANEKGVMHIYAAAREPKLLYKGKFSRKPVASVTAVDGAVVVAAPDRIAVYAGRPTQETGVE